ncbi:MAG TPA: hypothetical protein VFK05_19375 [Polyangiaceae bacterium]|nr:hypothetical protein [Polyangiaceae bacterium]
MVPPPEPSAQSPTIDPSPQPATGAPPAATGAPPPAMQSPGCAEQVLESIFIPVHGTVTGPKVAGVICENGLGTFFLGPEDSGLTPYEQAFYTTTKDLGAVVSPSAMTGTYGFHLTAPAAAVSADLSGWVGASAAVVGTYTSAANCGFFDFTVTLPIPPDVVCTTPFSPCDPGCEGTGEAFVCVPAPARLRYQARPAATCQSQPDPAQGGWQLNVTSVAALGASDTHRHFNTHGQLQATLINRDDATDSVTLDLEF